MEQQQHQNYFRLYPIPINNEPKFKHIEINYSPSFNEIQNCFMETIPIFNDDHDPAQPGFIPPIDKPLHVQHNQQYQMQYKKKYLELTTKNRILQYPKPKSQSKFCNVCKQHYDDYLQHILSKQHKTQFTKHHYIKKISQQINEFRFTVQPIEQSETEVQIQKSKKIKCN